jgi:hypothetical protein
MLAAACQDMHDQSMQYRTFTAGPTFRRWIFMPNVTIIMRETVSHSFPLPKLTK